MRIAAAEPSPWFGQPRGLTILFLTNMWEQFSYFGMRALLVYYMTKQLLIGQEQASSIYGAYIAVAYLTPVIGGPIADRLLGKRRAIIIGGTIMAAGHFMMTFEPLLYPALATIAIGNGLFLPSLPSQINDLYAPDDPRRAWAYNVYYVGINVGGFLAPFVCGTLGEAYGWHYGFGAAGVGMLVGLLIYIWGQRYLPTQERGTATRPDARPPRFRLDRPTVLALGGIALSVIVFRNAYEQVGNTIALWADAGVDRHVGAFTIPMTWFQALNPLLVMLMTPALLGWWRCRAEAGRIQSSARKMATGALLVASAYLLLAAVTWVNDGAPAGWPWLVGFFVLFTLGELFILPTGLGLFARLAPPGTGATMVAAWYVTISIGSASAGQVGRLWSRTTPTMLFLLFAAIAVAAALLLRLLDRPLRALTPDDAAGRVPAR